LRQQPLDLSFSFGRFHGGWRWCDALHCTVDVDVDVGFRVYFAMVSSSSSRQLSDAVEIYGSFLPLRQAVAQVL